MVSSVNIAYEGVKALELPQPRLFFFNQGKKGKMKSPSSAKKDSSLFKENIYAPH